VADRYTTALDLAEDLRASIASAPVTGADWGRATVILGLVLGLVVGLVIFVAIGSGWFPGAGDPVDRGQTTPAGAPSDPPEAALPVRELPASPVGKVDWAVLPEENQLRIAADDVAFLSLGEIGGGEFEFSVGIDQPGWPGNVGLFFNFAAQEGNDKRVNYQLI